ncbi:TetR/AcrR family transcriptional regulator [Falsibacillus pallidus]|uniref:TetR family transcriptional regulator n=1 Tax=Falsibacillus pallidus TaxID=493781 RepID=A0A370G688_9BACI|nr:TetR/AcrR family transcriptional regulator [Falsibacillus pallidus]RDI37553.1 TetR family transcriptional regulator [Falsibacillus pallidus]
MTTSDMVEELFSGENLTDKQKRIIEAAILTFSKNGFSGTSTREIAIKAGVAEGTIFRYYHTKNDLLQTIMDRTLIRLTDFYLDEDDLTNPSDYENNNLKDFVKKLSRNKYQFVKRYTPIIKILLQEFAFQKANWEPYLLGYYTGINREFRNIYLKMQTEGDFTEIEPKVAFRLTLSTIVGYLLMKHILLQEENLEDEDEVEVITNYVINGLLTKIGF